jgi:hypothetical protein
MPQPFAQILISHPSQTVSFNTENILISRSTRETVSMFLKLSRQDDVNYSAGFGQPVQGASNLDREASAGCIHFA